MKSEMLILPPDGVAEIQRYQKGQRWGSWKKLRKERA